MSDHLGLDKTRKEGLEMSLPVNKVVVGDCVAVMQSWPAGSVDLVVTSPPYWGLRDYGEETVKVWGGDPECEHEWVKSKSSLRERHHGEGSKTFFKDCWSPEASLKRHIATNKLTKTDPKSNFCAKCGAWRGGLGLEPHPQLFIDHLVEIFREVKRVLKPSGTFWLNLGDTYFGGASSKAQGKHERLGSSLVIRKNGVNRAGTESNWLQPKQKLMIPARVAIALQHDGWILRNDIIWHKPNAMPSSVKDRLTCVYDHVFLFVKQRHYYFDLDAIRKPHSASTIQRITQPNVMNQQGGEKQIALRGKKISPKDRGSRSADMVKSLAENYEEWYFSEREKKSWHDHEHDKTMGFGQQKRGFKVKNIPHPKGKNPGDLWRIPTNPFPGAHFATFPPKLINPIIKASCPRWICSQCGKPRTRITKDKSIERFELPKDDPRYRPARYEGKYSGGQRYHSFETIGWSDCGCEADWVSGVVLDPFAGSGTALRVARKLGRRFIGIEINPEYAAMAEERVRSDKYKPAPPGVVKLTEILEK